MSAARDAAAAGEAFDGEPVRGLPETLPAGERMLWQGAPAWRTLGWRSFHARWIAAYFGVLIGWRAITAMADHEAAASALTGIAHLLALGGLGVGLVMLFAWLTGRSTVYTVTDRRLVIRFGIALPMSINLPFKSIDQADMKVNRDGTGDIVLSLVGHERVSYLVLWPHVQPWKLSRAQPTLRAIPEAATVAQSFARALAAEAGMPVRAAAEPLAVGSAGPDTAGAHAAAA